jgi:hypothetical protein
VFRVNESPDAHVFDAVSATENRNVPEVLAVHTEIWVSVSLLPPLVHADGAVPSDSAEPDEELLKMKEFRVLDPALTLEVPAAPGSPTCS